MIEEFSLKTLNWSVNIKHTLILGIRQARRSRKQSQNSKLNLSQLTQTILQNYGKMLNGMGSTAKFKLKSSYIGLVTEDQLCFDKQHCLSF